MSIFLNAADAGFESARYDWRGLSFIDEEHYAEAQRLTTEVCRASVAIVLAEAGHPNYADSLGGAPVRVLISDDVTNFWKLRLGQTAFRRFVFREVIARTIAGLRDDDPTRSAVATYLRPSLESPQLDAATAEELWTATTEFFDRWIPKYAFFELFTLPLRTGGWAPHSPEKHGELVDELHALALRSIAALGSKPTWDMLSFWIARVRDANVWRDAAQEAAMKNICAAEAAAAHSYEEAGGWIEYLLGYYADQTIAWLIESASELYFPIDGVRAPLERSASSSWLGTDFFERAQEALYHVKDHPKGRRVLDACREYGNALAARELLDDYDDSPIVLKSLTREEVIQTHRFLISHARKHFLGHVAEMLALPLAIRAAGDRFGSNVTCIPGTAIRYAGSPSTQGPDAVFATLTTEGGRTHLRVHGIVEVKGCDTAQRLLREELDNHVVRLTGERVHLTYALGARSRWEPRSVARTSSKNGVWTDVAVDSCEVDDDVLKIAVVPGRPSRRIRAVSGMLKLQLPWTAAGIREMTRGFVVAMLRESANKVDTQQDDYFFGRDAWVAALRPYLGDPDLTREDRRSMEQLATSDIHPDRHLLAALTGT